MSTHKGGGSDSYLRTLMTEAWSAGPGFNRKPRWVSALGPHMETYLREMGYYARFKKNYRALEAGKVHTDAPGVAIRRANQLHSKRLREGGGDASRGT